MKKILKGIIRIILAIVKALHFIWEALCVVVIVGCIVILAILALIAEMGERLFSFISSTLTALVSRLGNKLIKEKT
jgi:hypothetical protein